MPKVVLYSRISDPYSVRLSELLRRKKVPFTEKRVSDDDPDTYMEMVNLTGESEAPQLVVDGQHVGDYETVGSLDLRGKLDELLGL